MAFAFYAIPTQWMINGKRENRDMSWQSRYWKLTDWNKLIVVERPQQQLSRCHINTQKPSEKERKREKLENTFERRRASARLLIHTLAGKQQQKSICNCFASQSRNEMVKEVNDKNTITNNKRKHEQLSIRLPNDECDRLRLITRK